jgi:hypothetical protein
MTIIQLYHRISRHARTGDFTKLSMTEQGDVAEAANAALQRMYNALPLYFKELTMGVLFPVPRTVTLGVTQYSTVLTAAAFTTAEIGRSVVIPGDAAWNQVIDTDTLLNPYLGPTGTVSATVYGDAAYSTVYPLDRISGNPRFSQSNQVPLMRSELSRGMSALLFSQTIGAPQVWWTQTFGTSQGKSPVVCLRVAPAPDQAYVFDVKLAFWPKRFTVDDITNAITIPVPDQFIDSALIPMALRALMLTPVWDAGRKDEDRIDAAGKEGELFLRQQPGQIGAPDNRIFTPIGF